jgi:hypothetical protein
MSPCDPDPDFKTPFYIPNSYFVMDSYNVVSEKSG